MPIVPDIFAEDNFICTSTRKLSSNLSFKLPDITISSNTRESFAAILCLCLISSDIYCLPALAQDDVNTLDQPRQILHTKVKLTDTSISSNSRQLAEHMKITELLKRIQDLRKDFNPINFEPIPENIAKSQQLTIATLEASQVIQETNLAIDFTLAEITAEEVLYQELLTQFGDNRNQRVTKTNAVSFILNGLLWSVAEATAIPTYRQPKFAIPSGSVGIIAGIMPSLASMYALHQLTGRKETSHNEPNMLSKFFNYPGGPEIEYPDVIWQFLNSVPPEDNSGKTRKQQLIKRWIEDKNLSSFKNADPNQLLDVLTASKSTKKALSIPILQMRIMMLQQLGAEILKMKRMLLELSMVTRGSKTI